MRGGRGRERLHCSHRQSAGSDEIRLAKESLVQSAACQRVGEHSSSVAWQPLACFMRAEREGEKEMESPDIKSGEFS